MNDNRTVKKIYEGRVFTLQVETVPLPGGGQRQAEIIRHPGSVVLVPVTEAGEIVLVKQFRAPLNRTTWELPAGTLKPGEAPERAAVRECHEEIGLVPGRLERLGALFSSPGYCDEEMHFYRATALRRPGPEDEAAVPDADEDIETQPFGIDALRRMLAGGEIVDMKTVAGLTLAGWRLVDRG